MPAVSKLGYKKCLKCEKQIVHKIRRDIERKKFCSRKCLGLYTGKNITKEHIQKMIKASNTPESNAKKSHKGENHPLYIKDRSKVKKPRLMSECKEWRISVFKRDNYTCQFCKQVGGKLEADHIKPYSIYPELRLDLNNGRTLCKECHKNTDTYGAKMRWKIARGEYAIKI